MPTPLLLTSPRPQLLAALAAPLRAPVSGPRVHRVYLLATPEDPMRCPFVDPLPSPCSQPDLWTWRPPGSRPAVRCRDADADINGEDADSAPTGHSLTAIVRRLDRLSSPGCRGANSLRSGRNRRPE